MNALDSLGFNQLQGIVESDQTFFRESMKGREITHRKVKKRAFDERVKQMLVSACRKTNHKTVEMLRCA